MEPDGDAPPFWAQPPPTGRRGRHRSSPLLNPVALILVIPIVALIVLFFVLPSFLAHTNQILRPNSVKKSWDSINILLVLFAILCGVFARRHEDAPPPEDERRNAEGVSARSNTLRHLAPAWMDSPDRKEYNMISGGSGGGRLRRSSSSYPDLRQEALWESGGSRSRFLDDFDLNFYRSPLRENFDSRTRRRQAAEREEEAETIIREVTVDKFEVNSAPPPPTPPKPASPPPPPPPPSSTATSKKRRSFQTVPRKDHVERERKEEEISENRRPTPPPPPPPPPEPTPEFHSSEVKHEPIHRRKSGGTKDFATAIASLYKAGSRKRKKRVKSRDIYETAPQNSPPPSTAEARSTPPPPPPPPPPPSKVLQNLFKKSSKSKRVYSVPTTAQTPPPPPPPPPPPNSIFNNLFKTGSKSRRFERTSTTPPAPPPPPPPSAILNSIFKTDGKSRRSKTTPLPPPSAPPPAPAAPLRPRGRPPKPTKPITQYHEESTTAPPSPLIPLPPPPPPPPFRMPEIKFAGQGDFVQIHKTNISRSSSPDLEDIDATSVKSDVGDTAGPSSISCPSPDVNAKADTFIARLRDEWRLEKMNSMKEKRKLH
ncbi:uncharacterized protein LOC127252189 [Andrographis paniculata]|uniref:uncharacterized protein LOC127252189 n=1 Tax=Andrographis paniculata TaxID=175694 RepID=UPI0021E79F73|nr:uncharacterized protein LOC127252189 [Andrographis paniculata]